MRHPTSMSAKKSSRSAPATPLASSTPAPSPAASAAGPSAPPPAWIDSDDPRKRLWGKIVLVAAWVYVAALCLLALDQTFHWGIFGPKVPPIP